MKMKWLTCFLLSLVISGQTFAAQDSSAETEEMAFAEAKEEIVLMMQNAEQESLIEATIAANTNSCIADIHSRLNQLKRRTIFAPFLGFGEVYAGMYVGAVIGAALGMAVESSGWTGLAYALSGAVVGGQVALVAYGIQQAVVITRLVHMNQMEKALLEAEGQKEGSKYLDKLVKKYLRKYPEDKNKMDRFAMVNFFKTANQNGTLCNGDMVNVWRRKSEKKLKQRIPLRKELFKAIHEAI